MPRKRYSEFSREDQKRGSIAWSVVLGENQYRQFKSKRDALKFAEDLKDEEWGLRKTAEKMGHYRNIDVLRNNYQHIAYSVDSERYFDL